MQVTLVYQPERSNPDEKENKPIELKSVFLLTQRLLKETGLKK